MIKFTQYLLKLTFKIAPPLGIRLAYLLFCWPVFGKIRNRELRIRSKAKKFSSKINGKLIKQFQWGSSGKKVFLVHGWASNAGGLGGFVNPFTKAGYQVFAFDGPAHGESEGHITNLIDFANTLQELLKEEQPDIIITHSFGSAAAVVALSEDININISKMIMLTTPDALEDVIRDFSIQMGLSDYQHNLLVDYISSRFGVDVDKMLVHELAQNIEVDQSMLIHDHEDNVLSFRGAERVAQHWKPVEFIPVKNKGHYRILWDTEIINRVIKFVEK